MHDNLLAIWAIIVALLLLYVPGLACVLPARMRASVKVALAPGVSVGMWAVLAIILPMAGMPWRLPLVVLIGAVFSVVMAAIGVVLVQRRPDHPRSSRAARIDLMVGALGGFVCGAFFLLEGTNMLRRPAQRFDAIFHIVGTEWVTRHADASSLHLGQVTGGAFYPGAWHGLCSLVEQAGVDAIYATNAVSCAVLLPVVYAAASAAYVLTSGMPGAAAAGGLLAATVIAYPYRLMTYGTLWPNYLAYALVAGLMVVVIDITRRLRADERFGLYQWLLVAVATVGIGLAQPNGVLAAGLLALPAVLVVTWQTLRRRIHPRGWDLVAVAGWPIAVAALVVLGARSPIVQGLLQWREPRIMPDEHNPLSIAAGGILDNQAFWDLSGNPEPAIILAVATLVGVVYLLLRSRYRWYVVTWVIAVAFFAASFFKVPKLRVLVALWYSDQYRIGGIIPLVAAPLAGVGVAALALGVKMLVSKWRPSAAAASYPAIVAILVVACAAGSIVHAVGPVHGRMADAYRPKRHEDILVTPRELQLQRDVADQLPAGSRVLSSPFTGAPMLYAVTDTDLVFPYFAGTWSEDDKYLAEHFDDIATDPKVCDIVKREKIGYYYWDPSVYVKSWKMDWPFGGLRYRHDLDPYMTLVAQRDRVRLWQITGCQ
ncbi:MAG: DUF6541 family protein [Actinomycetaceae bacterium]|nr:DUF6541 family protein [Actinomycetaceae bacterium]MDU0969716.1 DUF6541 family protein [Actinomycetaceae bacterium]